MTTAQFAVSVRRKFVYEPPLKDIESSGIGLLKNNANARENLVLMVLFLLPFNPNLMITRYIIFN
jgi:hypothetical protein